MANKIKDSNITPGTIAADKLAGGITNSQLAGSIANDKLAGSIANAKLANSSITINGTSIALGASGNIVAGTDWQAVKTANYTAVAGQGIFANTTGGAFTITLPASPTIGDEVTILDYAGTFASNNLTVARNGSKIDTAESDAVLSVNRTNVRFVFIDTTQGWRSVFDDVSTDYGPQYISATGGTTSQSGNYRIHTFTSTSNFVVSSVAVDAADNVVDYLVVAGGGSGPATNGGDGISGGGGGGGFRFFANPSTNPQSGNPASPLNAPAGITVSAQTYPITVGAGGSRGTAPSGWTNGSNSVFSTITSTGGGRGGRGDPNGPGQNGGSGGGGSNGPSPGGSGNTPPVSPAQGRSGAAGGPSSAGGGGGAIGVGTAGGPTGGPGGAGAGVTGFGTAGESSGGKYYFSGGGGGGNGNANSGNSAGSGGLGGAGTGLVPSDGTPATNAGTANTGGGGGGGHDLTPVGGAGSVGSNGGSGVVIIRYRFQ